VRLASVTVQGTDLLCVVADDDLLPVVGRFADVSSLLTAFRDEPSLEAAVHAAGGTERSVGSWHDALEGRNVRTPVRPAEVWAAGVTYARSRDARMAEARDEDIYERVYDAERPELFLKATGPRIVGPGDDVGLRSDSSWQVPEPELALVLDARARIIGFTLGNDMSSRDIEGENPLYLPQAKIYAASCALGPLVVSAEELSDPQDLPIQLVIERAGHVAVSEKTSTAQLATTFDRLVAYLSLDNWLPPATVLFTGTGVVPQENFSLAAGDVIRISSPAIGELVTVCAAAADLAPPSGWVPSGAAGDPGRRNRRLI